LKQAILENRYSYSALNTSAAAVDIGSNGVRCFPFGNGAERVLNNVDLKAHFSGINFNVHSKDTLVRAAQEGIAFAFRFGLDIMRSIGMNVRVIRAGSANLFQSEVFKTAFVNTCDVELELYNTDGSLGAARGAGIGAGLFSEQSAFKNLSVIVKQSPNTAMQEKYHAVYETWKIELDSIISRGGLE
jgi:xylulokinase